MQRTRLVLQPLTEKEFQENRFLRIVVPERFNKFTDADFNAQFLPQFAPQAFLKALGWLAFATGKFPETAAVSAGKPLGDKKLAVPKNQTRRDFNHSGTLDFTSGIRHAPCPRPMLL